jgi:hypothetical protein
VVRRGEVYRERRRNEDATVRTCGGAERWERRAWGSREPVTAAVAEAAAIGMLGRANVSAAEHGTEKAGVAAAGGLRKRRYPPIYLWEGVVRLHAGPTVYPEVGPISTVGLGEPLRRSGWELGKEIHYHPLFSKPREWIDLMMFLSSASLNPNHSL